MEKYPVLLIHGFKTRAILSNGKDNRFASYDLERAVPWDKNVVSEFGDLPKWLTEDGFEVYLASYQSNNEGAPGIEKCKITVRKQILELIKKTKAKKIIIVAHSFGGLVTRAYIDGRDYEKDRERLEGDFIESVFMVATPHLGAPFGWFFKLLFGDNLKSKFAACYECGSRDFLNKFNQEYPHINKVPYYLIGGKGGSTIVGKVLSSYVYLTEGDNDAICGVKSALGLKGATQTAVVRGAHGDNLGTSYYQAGKGGGYSSFYENCLRPVIVGGNIKGCAGEESVKFPKNQALLMLVAIGFRIVLLVMMMRVLARKILGSH